MSEANPRFAKLIELAKEPSSDKRRQLMRDVTDLFFFETRSRSSREMELFDDILCSLAGEMPEGVLTELSQRFAPEPEAPGKFVRRLANEPFAVAAPVLRQSPLLDDEDLITIINARSQDHIRAVAERARVSATVSEAIVHRGDDRTLDTLVRNQGAEISRATMEIVVDRAHKNPRLHEGVVGRRDMPIDLLNELYFSVEARLRQAILKRNAEMDPKELDKALAKARRRLHAEAEAYSARLQEARREIAALRAAGELNGKTLLALQRDNKPEHFYCGLAEMTGLDYEIVKAMMDKRDLDGLAMVCRASNIERPLFVSLAVLCDGGADGMRRAEEYGRLYAAVPVEAAQRAMRFYKIRKATEEQAAA